MTRSRANPSPPPCTCSPSPSTTTRSPSSPCGAARGTNFWRTSVPAAAAQRRRPLSPERRWLPRCPTYWTATTPPLHNRRRRLPRRSPSTACSIRCPRPRSPSEDRSFPTFSGPRTGHWVTPRRQKPTTHGRDRLRDAIGAPREPSSKSWHGEDWHGEDVQPVVLVAEVDVAAGVDEDVLRLGDQARAGRGIPPWGSQTVCPEPWAARSDHRHDEHGGAALGSSSQGRRPQWPRGRRS